jgi:LacI family transcriptional regulator
LLISTDLSAEQIAALCGFEHPEYLHVVFKRVTGMTIGTFRKQAKP